MNISYFFSSPHGDVPVDDETLGRPLVVEPLQTHPFLTLGDFFHIILHFLLGKAGPILASMLSQSWERNITLQDVDTMIIRYEKYGSLYQILSVEVSREGSKAKFAVSAALTPQSREAMKMEYNLISYINTRTGLPYLPRVFSINSEEVQKNDQTETVVLTFAEWFEGYHEWHFTVNDDGKTGIIIWDMGCGQRTATDEQAYSIIREASKILTLYYDIESGERIIPWHHGAGDFIVNTDAGNGDVRLVTARGYERFDLSCEADTVDPSWGLIQFFIELTTKMRLDKQEGMGGPIWADGIFVKASVDGFYQAMKAKEARGQSGPINVTAFIDTLKALNEDDFLNLIHSYLDQNQTSGTADHRVIQENAREHASDLANVLRQLVI